MCGAIVATDQMVETAAPPSKGATRPARRIFSISLPDFKYVFDLDRAAEMQKGFSAITYRN